MYSRGHCQLIWTKIKNVDTFQCASIVDRTNEANQEQQAYRYKNISLYFIKYVTYYKMILNKIYSFYETCIFFVCVCVFVMFK
jgi:hypothetical protein